MTTKNPQNSSQLVKSILTMSPQEAGIVAAEMSVEQLLMAFSSLTESYDSHWQKKIRILYHSITNEKILEGVSRTFNYKQALEILEIPSQTTKINSLSPLFIGLSPKTFVELVVAASPKQIHIIQQEAHSEPVQHQLTLFLHELEHEEEALTMQIQSVEKKLHAIDLLNMSREDLKGYYLELDLFSQTIERALHKIDKALAIAWNSNRIDLVDRLSQLKEYYSNDKRVGIGHRDGKAITGLIGKFEKRLHEVYGSLKTGDLLDDSDPASEALAKLSVWSLKDYWELGLLPHIQKKELLECPSNQASPKEKLSYQDQLREVALENLRITGLASVGDFKEHHLFSKTMLIQFLSNHFST